MQVFTPLILKKKKLLIRTLVLCVLTLSLLLPLSQVVFARNTYVITDGDQVKVHTTYTTDPRKVLSEAGFLLEANDTYFTQSGDGVSEITVRRSQTITVRYGKSSYQVLSYGETLKTLLDRVGLPTRGNFEASLPLSTQTYDGMEVTVSNVTHAQEVYTVDIPYKTSYCYDPELPEGTQEVLIPGTAGQMRCTAAVTYTDGRETGRTVVEEKVVQQPISQVIAIGTAEEAPAEPAAPVIGDGIIITADGEILPYEDILHVKATAYTQTDAGCSDTTATGTKARVGAIAVDPKVIPYGTRMFIVSDDGAYIYGIATAEDCGGAIKGNRVDLYFDTTKECFQFGVRKCTIYVLGNG